MNLINIKKKINDDGIAVLKKINNLSDIKKLEKKVLSHLNKPSLIKTPKKISKQLYNSKEFRGPVGNLKYNLNKNSLKKGVNFYRTKTNAISFKQPLLHFRESINLVFIKVLCCLKVTTFWL